MTLKGLGNSVQSNREDFQKRNPEDFCVSYLYILANCSELSSDTQRGENSWRPRSEAVAVMGRRDPTPDSSGTASTECFYNIARGESSAEG